jgi:hypothetical protein
MSDYRDVLERIAVRATMPEPAMERMLRRRSRRQRNQRLIAGGVGLAIGIALVAGATVASRSARREPVGSPSPRGIFTGAQGSVVFGDSEGLWRGIWAVDPTAPVGRTQLPGIRGRAIPMAWSSDGTELLVTRSPAHPSGPWNDPSRTWVLTVIHADGSMTSLPWASRTATFTPDGREVIAPCPIAATLPTQLCIGPVDGTSHRPFASVPGFSPVVSPDGSRIAFVSRSASHDLVVMDADGTGTHVVVDGSGITDVSSIAWSPDGSRIAFEGNGPRGVYVVGVDGSGLLLLARSATRPYWSPDGTRIVFERAGLNVIDADGTDRRWVGSYPSGPWAP